MKNGVLEVKERQTKIPKVPAQKDFSSRAGR
jgi:hypothetical protein